jgi:threonine dehydratase
MSGEGPFDAAYIQIGGGGLASAVACWLKSYYPNIRIVGVEGVGQASMKAALDAGHPVDLPYVDVFCDGTAVRRVGERTYAICSELLDDVITVSNEEVCAAIQTVWEASRCIPEPSGAMGLAGLLKDPNRPASGKVLTILCGANLDFGQLAWICRHAGIGGGRRRYLRLEIAEKRGGMLDLLDHAMDGINIIEFQYGKVHPSKAWPVLGIEATPLEHEALDKKLRELGIPFEDVTSTEDVEFRIIHYDPTLFDYPYFITLEFPERPGALHDFLALLEGTANMCYFNYSYTGEQVGRALLGFEFTGKEERERFLTLLAQSHHDYQEVSAEALKRVL